MDKNFPFWPPTSPQRPAEIAGRQSLFVLEDLGINQIPIPRSEDIPFIGRPIPRIRKPELPANAEKQFVGRYGSNLYDLIMLTTLNPQLSLSLQAGEAEKEKET